MNLLGNALFLGEFVFNVVYIIFCCSVNIEGIAILLSVDTSILEDSLTKQNKQSNKKPTKDCPNGLDRHWAEQFLNIFYSRN